MRVAVAAPVWARGPEEASLLAASLTALSRHRLPVVLADGGSESGFLRQIAALPGIQIHAREEPGLLGQVRLALEQAAALGVDTLLYTEPDKRWFFDHRLSDFLESARHCPPAVHIAARDADSFATFPAGQQLTEDLTNRLCDAAFGLGGDYLYGPLLLPASLVPHLAALPADIGWGWRIALLAVAQRRELPLLSYVADLPCPPEQRGEDEERSRLYRIEQMAQNVRGLALGLKTPLSHERGA